MGKLIICSQNLRLVMIRNIKLIAFEIAQSMPESQYGNYQDSITWFCKKTILRKKISGSLHR